jgi:hypothetical protein
VDDFTWSSIDVICGCEKASFLNIRGMDGFAKRERPTSTMCLCFLSTYPFC